MAKGGHVYLLGRKLEVDEEFLPVRSHTEQWGCNT